MPGPEEHPVTSYWLDVLQSLAHPAAVGSPSEPPRCLWPRHLVTLVLVTRPSVLSRYGIVLWYRHFLVHRFVHSVESFSC